MKKHDWPFWAYKSARDFRAEKRQKVRAALKATDQLRFGCAYTPAHEHIVAAFKHLEAAKDLMSVKRWKR